MRPRTSPFAYRRFLTEAPVHLTEPSPDPVLLPALAALARSGGDPAEVRAILAAVPPALHVVMVDRMMGRTHLAPAMAVVLEIVPRSRLKALGGTRLACLYKAVHGLRPAAQPVR